MWIGRDTIENSMVIPKKLKIELPYDPAVLLLDISPVEIKSLSWRDLFIPISTEAFFIIARICKHPKGLSINEQRRCDTHVCGCARARVHTDTHTHTHTLEYYSAMKKKEFCHSFNMDKPWVHYAKGNKSGRESLILYAIT